MIETVILQRLSRIFDLKKTTLDKPSESQEQAGLFVDIQNSNIRIRDGRIIARCSGVLNVFAPVKELPAGYTAKKIAEAAAADTEGFFFGPEAPLGTYRDLVQRRLDFQFLFDGQYDPSLGNITSIELDY